MISTIGGTIVGTIVPTIVPTIGGTIVGTIGSRRMKIQTYGTTCKASNFKNLEI